MNMQHGPPVPTGMSRALSSSAPSRLDAELVWRTGCTVGSRRLRRRHLRPRVIAFCGQLLGQRFPAHGVVSRLSLLAIGRRRRVGRGKEEVDLAVLERGVQGLLIEQLRGLGLDEDPRAAVIDEGITGRRRLLLRQGRNVLTVSASRPRPSSSARSVGPTGRSGEWITQVDALCRLAVRPG